MSADLFNALAHPREAVACFQLLHTFAVIAGADFYSICRLEGLNPQVLGPGMPYRVCNNLLDAPENRLRANGIVNPQVFWYVQMNPRLWNAFGQRADRSSEIEAVIAPQTIYDITNVLQEEFGH